MAAQIFSRTARAVPSGAAPHWARSPWVRLPVMLVLFGVVFAAVEAGTSAAPDTGLPGLFIGLAAAAAAIAVYTLLVRWLERRAVAELAPRPAAAGLGRGALAGLGLFAVTIGLIALFGGYRITGTGSVTGMLAILGLMTAAAAAEELLFRGVLFRLLEELTGSYGALAISGVLFGVIHLVNPHATIWGALAIAIEAGLMLGAAYAATRSLWLVIGLHLGWNFAEAGIFSTATSGTSSQGPLGLFTGTEHGPAVLTGGGFGPEASLLAIVVCAVPTALFVLAARRRGRLYPRLQPAGRPAGRAAVLPARQPA